MQITVNIPQHVAEQANARGLAVEVYVERLLEERDPGGNNPGLRRPRSQAEVEAWLNSLSAFSEKAPALPETITREWLYQDHD